MTQNKTQNDPRRTGLVVGDRVNFRISITCDRPRLQLFPGLRRNYMTQRSTNRTN